MLQKKIKMFVALAAAVIGVGGWFGNVGTNAAYAEGAPEYQMQISPVKAAIEKLEPGEVYEGKFEVRNTGQKKINFTVKGAPYSVSNEKYDPDFNTTNAYTELNEWMTVTPSEGEIEPGGSVEVEYVIEVPENAHGGQQNAAIIVQATNQDSTESSAVQALGQIGYIIYSNVKGETNESAQVTENHIPKFLLSPPVKVTAIVENTGNVYGEATYTLQVYKFFGNEEVYSNESEPEKSIVFAGTKRYNEMSWAEAPQLGIYRVKQTVKIFDTESVEEKVVFLCPVWLLFVVLLAIFLAVFWIASKARGKKK